MKTWGNDTQTGLDPDYAAPAYIRIPQMAIVLAVQDACGKASDRTQDAMDWIFGAGGNFEDLALLAGWDADWLRRKVRELLDSGLPMKRTTRHFSKGRPSGECDDPDEWETNATPPLSSLRDATKRTTQQARHPV